MRPSACTCLLILATALIHSAKAAIEFAEGLDLNTATASFRVADRGASESQNSDGPSSSGTFAIMVAVAICAVIAGHSRQWVLRQCGYIWELQVQFTRAFLIYTLSNKSGQPIVLNGGVKDMAEAKNKTVRPRQTHGVRRDFSLSSSLNSGYCGLLNNNLSTRHKSWVLEQSLKQATLENSPMLMSNSPQQLPRQSKQQEIWPAHSPATNVKAVSPGKTRIIQMQVSELKQHMDHREALKPNVGRLRELDFLVNGSHRLLDFTLDEDEEDKAWSDNDDGDPRAPPVPSGDPMEGEDVGLNPRTELKLPPPAHAPHVLGFHGRRMCEMPWEVPRPSVKMAMKNLRQHRGSNQHCYMP